MRIIQVTPDFPPDCGGTGYYVYYLSKELVRKGYDVSVIFRGRHDRTYSYDGIMVKEIKVFGSPPFNLPIFKKKLTNILARERMDLVHIHSSAMPAINCDCPVMVTAHWCNRQGIPASHRPIKDIDSLYRSIMLPIYTKIESKLAKSCEKLTVVSDSLRREFERYYHVKADVIHNGIDTDLFDFNQKVKKDDAILFTGKLGVGKGVLDLLSIAEMLKKSHPKTKLQIIGKGPLKNYIRRRLKKKDLYNVAMIDQLPHSELIAHYHRARVYVLPTYYEGLPTTILEAMACQLPVIATNVSGIPEQIDEGVNGFMLSTGDIQGFYKRIVELLESPQKRETLGKNARKKVLEKFTWPQVAKRITSKYRELLN